MQLLELYKKAIEHYENEDFSSAKTLLQLIYKKDNNFEQTECYLADCYFFLKNKDTALRLYCSYIKKWEDSYALQMRAELLFTLGLHKSAIRDIIAALRIEAPEQLPKYERINKPVNSFVFEDDCNFEKLGFSEFDNTPICGIYILVFKNEELYVGQSVNIAKRLVQHKKRYLDIEYIFVKEVQQDNLYSEENRTIAFIESKLIRLRNTKQLSFHSLFNETHQKQWIENITYKYNSGIRYSNEEVRLNYHDRLLKVKEKTYFDEVSQILSYYIQNLIPNYTASEYTYWSLSCLPKYLKKEHCICRIQINNVPVISIFEQEDNSLSYILFISRVPLLRSINNIEQLKSVLNRHQSLYIDIGNHFKDWTNGDSLYIKLNQENIKTFLAEPLFIESIRLFNLRMMNNTGKEKKYRRTITHCIDWVDELLKFDNLSFK